MHKNEGALCLWQVTRARRHLAIGKRQRRQSLGRHLAIGKRQRRQSLVPLRANVSASVPDGDIRPPLVFYSLAASMIASANDGCG